MSNKIKICHFSDWHSQFSQLPEANVYVCSGDILTNYPIVKPMRNGWSTGFDVFGPPISRIIDHRKERECQNNWFRKKFLNKNRTLRHFFPETTRDNPVVVVRGNHEFTDLGPMFGGEVFEIGHDASRSVEYCGLVFGGFRGVPTFTNEWCDEFSDEYLQQQVDKLPDNLDVVVTHAPPYNILDNSWGEKIGMKPLASWINLKQYDGSKMPKLFCFGHCHDDFGFRETDDGTKFSNAATTRRIIELEL